MDYTRSGVSRSVSGTGQWSGADGQTRTAADRVAYGDETVASGPTAVTRCSSAAARDGAAVAASR